MAGGAWPADWGERRRGRDCPFCSSLGQGDNDFTVAVATRPFSEVRLERRSRLPGYCVVVWRFGHVAEPTELTGEQATGYFADVVATGRANSGWSISRSQVPSA
jgi:hypothetical protein